MRLRVWGATLLAALLLGGCSGLGYYWQSVAGHARMVNAARPVQDWMADPDAPAALKERLALSQRMRRFAVEALHLPDNASYTRYADLHRSAVVWNVVAAPPFSLRPKTFCFPVAGCVGYRGYFAEADARAEAAQQQAEGLEVTVYGVPAYSTLGWMNLAGGDPLLNTFIRYPEGELARILFHELSHQVAYAPGDTPFNESFATAVERIGGARWLAQQASPAARAEYAALDSRRQAFRALTLQTRRELASIYGEAASSAESAESAPDSMQKSLPAQEKRPFDAPESIAKQNAMQRFREGYAALKDAWGGFSGYDLRVAGANNASFAAQAAYDDWVPAFEALFEREGRDFPRFYAAVRALAALPPAARHQWLRGLPPAGPPGRP
jgi:predicted aminopeptidase